MPPPPPVVTRGLLSVALGTLYPPHFNAPGAHCETGPFSLLLTKFVIRSASHLGMDGTTGSLLFFLMHLSLLMKACEPSYYKEM